MTLFRFLITTTMPLANRAIRNDVSMTANDGPVTPSVKHAFFSSPDGRIYSSLTQTKFLQFQYKNALEGIGSRF